MAADNIILNNEKISYKTGFAFIYDINDKKIFFVNQSGETHGDIINSRGIIYLYSPENNKNNNIEGRLWLDEKIISFWRFDFSDMKNREEIITAHERITNDNPLTFLQTLKLIEKNFNKKFDKNIKIDDTWLIDVPIKFLNNDDDVKSVYNYVVYKTNYSLFKIKDFMKISINDIDTEGLDTSKAIHLLTWKEKQELKKKGWVRGWGSDMTSWDSKNPLQWRQAKYQENLRNIQSFKLFEYGDYIFTNYKLNVKNGRPFAYWDKHDTVIIGEKGSTHMDNLIYHPDYDDDNNLIDMEWKWHGRLWLQEKIITFWYYPDPKTFKHIINLLGRKLDRNLWNLGWKIQIHRKKDNNIIYGDIEVNPYLSKNTELIPIEEYVGSENSPKEEVAIHLLNWKEKQELKKKGWGRGWGSDMISWDSKNPLQWRQAKYQENKKYKF